MTPNRIRILYCIYIVSVAIFFIYYLFPDEAVKKYIFFKINTVKPFINLTADQIKPVFPPGLKFENLSISQNNISFVDVAELKISPRLLSFFSSVNTFFFRAQAYGGNIQGRLDLNGNKPDRQFVMESTLSAIQIGNSVFLQRLIGRKISGSLAGEVHVIGSKLTAGGVNARLNITDFMIELLTPIINMENLTFKNIAVDLTTDEKKIRIKTCTLQGDHIAGNLAGVVEVREPLKKSVLNLTGMMKPNTQFLADLKKQLPQNVLLKRKVSKNGFPLRLIGTLDNPLFSLN